MELEKIFKEAKDFLPLLGTDYVEFYVGNAKQAAHFYKSAFGFQSYAYKGLETNSIDVSYVLIQDKIKIVLTSPLSSSSSINDHIVKHGDGIKIIALWVEDAEKSWKETTSREIKKSYMEPTLEKDEHGEIIRSGIYTYETVHILLREKNYKGVFSTWIPKSGHHLMKLNPLVLSTLIIWLETLDGTK